jgi:hypothetical protein
VTRGAALSTLRQLAHGLGPALAGTARLLERIAGQDGEQAELLRDLLVEEGARALLDREARP